MHKSLRYLVVFILLTLLPSVAFAAKTHRVKKSETLYSLAKKYHVSVDELKSANNLVGNKVKGGMVLVIPPRSDVAAKTGAEKNSPVSYKVRKGDTIAKVAKKTGISVAELKRLNGLGKGKLKPGRILALRDSDTEESAPKSRVAKRLHLKNSDLFNEKDYEQTLAEIADPNLGASIDLSKSIELKADNLQQLKKSAFGFLGTRYRFGGSSMRGIDCSSFVQQVFRQLDVQLPRTAREQFAVGEQVATGDLKKGDLVFFRTYASFPSHVGIYLGDTKMIHASSRDRKVVISTMNTPYYLSRFIGAKRVGSFNPEVFRFEDLIAGIEEETADDIISNDTMDVGLSK